MGGREALLPSFGSDLTSGQLLWFYLNRLIDADERRRAVHLQCRGELERRERLCEVCGEEVEEYEDYLQALEGKILDPSEWFEHQLHMSPEEKTQRTMLFHDLFRETDPDYYEQVVNSTREQRRNAYLS
jgi:hypothetical protein